MMSFGWTVEYTLNLPAKRFFALGRAARDIYAERQNHMYAELCDIVVCATGNHEYHEKLRGVYHGRLHKAVAASKANVYDLTDPVEGMLAAKQIVHALKGQALGG